MTRFCGTIIAIGLVLSAALSLPAAADVPIDYHSVKTAMEHLNRPFDLLARSHCFGPCVIPYRTRPDKMAVTACPQRAGCYGLNICAFPDTFGARAGTIAASYALIADTAVTYRRVLADLGYPSTVGEQTIAAFEQYEIRRARAVGAKNFPNHGRDAYTSGRSGFTWDNLWGAIQRDMSTYSRLNPGLRGFVPQGGCGGGGITLTIAAVPAAARIFIIPSFYYEVCKAQRINANDLNTCDHWREIVGGTIDDISGEYHYLVQWSDGVIRRGVLSADDFSKLGAMGKPLTLRKP